MSEDPPWEPGPSYIGTGPRGDRVPLLNVLVRGVPAPQGSVKAFTPKGWTRPILTSTSKDLKTWRGSISSAVQDAYHGPCLEGPVRLRAEFYLVKPKSRPKKKVTWPDTRPDLDKLARAVLDALTGVLYRDDSQVVELVAFKQWAWGPDGQYVPGVRIKAWTMEG